MVQTELVEVFVNVTGDDSSSSVMTGSRHQVNTERRYITDRIAFKSTKNEDLESDDELSYANQDFEPTQNL